MKIRLILTLVFVFFVSSLLAKKVYFKHISGSEGLSQLSAISIWQDPVGCMWFGNSALNKYDGNRVETFRISNYTNWREDNNIRSICGDSAGIMYVLANKDIISYNLHTEQFCEYGIKANAICFADNVLYYAQNDTLFTYSAKKQTQEKIISLDNTQSSIQTLLSSGKNELLIGTSSGVYRVNTRKQTSVCIYENEHISCLFIDSHKNIWIGTQNDGVRVILPNGSIKSIRQEDKPGYALSNNSIRCFEEDTEGTIWIGTYTGITVVNTETQACTFLLHNELLNYTLQYNSVYAIYKDKQGTMWVGTYYGGVSYSNPSTELYNFYPTENDKQESLKGYIIGPMIDNKAGKLYIGSEKGGLNIFNQSTQKIEKSLFNPDFIPHNTIKSLWYDEKVDHLYIGTFKDGLLLYLPQKGTFTPLGNTVLKSPQQQIIQQIIPYEKYLILLTQEEIYKLDRTTYSVTPLFNNEKTRKQCSGMIRTIHIDKQNKLWVSSVQYGLFTVNLSTEEIKHYIYNGTPGCIGKSPIIKICSNNKNELYLATLGTGIFRYNHTTENFTNYNKESQLLLSDVCYNIAFSTKGSLIITSDKGITLFNVQKNISRHIQSGENFPLKAITGNCGLYVSPFTEDIYIGGVSGLLSFSEKDMCVENKEYELYFSSLSVNNKPVSPRTHPDILSEGVMYAKEIKLKHNQNNISISFASSDYASVNYTQYEYKMEGFDSYWVETTFKTITYSALSPGKYILTVRESDNKSKLTHIHITVTPPFYASTIAWIVYFILISGIIYWFIRIQKSKIVLETSLKMEHHEKVRIEELNQAKLRFFTNISHEFRTPLTLIINQIELLLRADNTSLAIRNKLLRIKTHSFRMQELITELLDFRKQEAGKLSIKANKHNINIFLETIYTSFTEYALSRKITYQFSHTEEITEVWFDALQMQKVFYNLLSNAFKYTEDQGKITLLLEQKSDKVMISVTNSGHEISKDEIEKIFDRFYQSDNLSIDVNLPGSGIGLALSKGIIDAHKGTISVSSLQNQTSFQITLPLGDKHLKPEEKQESLYTPILPDVLVTPFPSVATIPDTIGTTPEDTRYTLLIVEDNNEIRQLIKEAFCPLYEVLEARNGEEGYAMAREKMPNLILSDIMMPGLSGTEMCTRLKKNIETSHIPVVLLTAQSSIEKNIEGLRHGADDYITKPFNLELLLLKCNNIVKTQQELQYKFCKQPLQQINELATNALDQELLSKSIALIEAHLDDTNFDITVWSKELAIGRTRLFNKIKAITGLTCNDFIINIKLKKAAALLAEQQELTISEIAYQLGFSTPSYFSKCFKNQYDITPLQYRKKVNIADKSDSSTI